MAYTYDATNANTSKPKPPPYNPQTQWIEDMLSKWNQYPTSSAPKNTTGDTGQSTGAGGTDKNSYASTSIKYNDPQDSYYEQMKGEINRQRREEERARRRAIEAGVGQLQGQIPLLGQQRDDAARQAYIRAQQAQTNMPQQMVAMGVTGGLSESAVMQANAGYQNTKNDLTTAYQNAVSGVNSDIANLRASGDLSLVESSGKYHQQLLDLAAKQAQAAQEQTKSYNSGGSGGGSGNDSGGTVDPYGFKGNDDYARALRSSAVANWLKKLDDNEQRNPPANEQVKNSERYYALKSAYNQGMFTDAEYSAIAKSWGIPV